MFNNRAYKSINFLTAFAYEVNGIFRAEGFYDGTILIHTNRTEFPDHPVPVVKLCQHGAPIVDLHFVVTDDSGISATDNCLLLASASYDQRIILWTLKFGKWKPLKIYTLDDEYCTSISSDQRGEKITFSLSNGVLHHVNVQNCADSELDAGKTYDDGVIYACIDPLQSEKFIIGNDQGEFVIFQGDGKAIKTLKVSDSAIRYIDMSDKIVITCDDSSILVIDRINYQITHAETAIKKANFRPVMTKIEPITEALITLSDDGQISHLMRFPNGSYREML
ncbi:hypothetical protein TRFO_03047 [Tritrichomonas foetus]|uniref:Uncharacterized protein n=1 Tax=Tritrichomonas foetus TaxID=1144522 RepID=A0A1J4KU26_9EUKA|nr:hypothetical protein TRFO_03047 [Tritrichomonas foetus]|eukprot:OHT14767.1 hypothetical protein TRFO_03047 [Tritrichomonas foetus]